MAQTVSCGFDAIGERTGVFTLDGTCDPAMSVEVEQRILAALGTGRTEIVFDLRGVSSLGPSLLDALVRGLSETKDRSGTFVLVRPNLTVWSAFERAGLDRVVPAFLDL